MTDKLDTIAQRGFIKREQHALSRQWAANIRTRRTET
jgi:hypothetical protein